MKRLILQKACNIYIYMIYVYVYVYKICIVAKRKIRN